MPARFTKRGTAVSGRKNKKQCVYCGSDGPLSVDHVVPKSQWRKYHVKRRVIDNPSNRVTACIKCNGEKGSMSPKEWFALHPEYKTRFMREAKYLSNDIKRLTGLW
ncbi:MAG TPA: HNH endonuclease [Anaerolineae bacterium]|nr:HNH endonuclease [Anaerolineae bacterium]